MLKAYLYAMTGWTNVKESFAVLAKDDSGAAAVEYALLVGTIAAFVITVVGTLNGGLQSAFTAITNHLNKIT